MDDLDAHIDYEEVFGNLVAGIDLDDPDHQGEAFVRCIEYADQHLDRTRDYNSFLAFAADRLGQMRVHTSMINRMVDFTANERVYLRYSEHHGPELVGNRDGLAYLSKVLKELSEAKLVGDHVHLYPGDPPLSGGSYPLTFYFEENEWFDNHAREEERDEAEQESEEIPVRDVHPEDVVALMPVETLPPPLLMRQNKVYKVFQVELFDGQKVWRKRIREETERTYIFHLRRDDGEEQEVALDLDDEEIHFFHRDEVEQFG